MFKTKLKLYTLLLTIGITSISLKTNPAFASVSAPVSAAVSVSEETPTAYVSVSETENTSISNENENLSVVDYLKSIYLVTQKPELDPYVYRAFEIFETNKNKDSRVKVFEGDYLACGSFADYFNLNYGFTRDMEVKVYKGNSYFVAFPNTLNADEKLDRYMEIAKKAKSIADTLTDADADQTIQNITNWMDQNLTYNYDHDLTDKNYTLNYYGGYDGKSIVCGGYAAICYQLCSMNGIRCSVIDAIVDDIGNHTFNTIEYSTGVKYVDTTCKTRVSDTVWNNYRLTNLYEEALKNK